MNATPARHATPRTMAEARGTSPARNKARPTAARRVPPVPPTFAEKHRRGVRALIFSVAALAVFLAGMGTNSMLMMSKLGDIKTALKGGMLGGAAGPPQTGGGGAPGEQYGPQAPDSGGGSGTSGELEAWAQEQGLPAALPPQALQMLYQQYPDGVPEDMKQKIEEQFGG